LFVENILFYSYFKYIKYFFKLVFAAVYFWARPADRSGRPTLPEDISYFSSMACRPERSSDWDGFCSRVISVDRTGRPGDGKLLFTHHYL